MSSNETGSGWVQLAADAAEWPLLPWPASLWIQQQGAADPGPGPGPGLSLHGWQWPDRAAAAPALQAAVQRLLPAIPGSAGAAGHGPSLHIDLACACAPAIPQLGDDESYRLELHAQAGGPGRILIAAPRLWGALHGLHTLSQLRHGALQAGRSALPALRIADAPRHPWRGLLVDVARRALPFEDLLRLLDGMAAARLNVLHWHIGDDQAWRLASARHPELAARASAGFAYSLEQARTLVARAAERGIRVVPELDLPGHCWALGLARPELLCPPAPQTAQRGFGIFGAAVDPRQPALYDFIADLLDEWAELFPDAFVHIGGDELAPEAWRRLGLPLAETQAGHVRRLAQLLAARGKRLVGWDELRGPGLPEDALLQCWRGAAALLSSQTGQTPDGGPGPGLLRSAGFYLDQAHTAGFHWRTPLSHAHTEPAWPAAPSWQLRAELTLLPLQARLWCTAEGRAGLQLLPQGPGSLASWLPLRSHSFAPLPEGGWQLRAGADSDLGELELWCTLRLDAGQSGSGGGSTGTLRLGNLRHGCSLQPCAGLSAPPLPHASCRPGPLLGGEAALWSELLGPEQLDLRLWPRAFAVAERLWSDPAPDSSAGRALERTLRARLQATEHWAKKPAELGADAAQARALHALCGATAATAQDVDLLAELGGLLEPGSGYARHHSKKRAGCYHLDEPLDRLADALPVESRWALGLQALDEEAALRQLRAWQARLPAWQDLLQRHARLRPLLPLLPVLQALLELGEQLWQQETTAQPGIQGRGAHSGAQALLHASAQMVDELVPALVQALQARLDAR